MQPYFDIWDTVPLARYFVNSLIVAGAATVLSVIIAVFSAYAVSRYKFRGKRVFTVTVLSTQMFPGILFLLPLFLIFVNIGNSTGVALYGSRGGLILTYLTFSLPFSIWMLIGYFDSIPPGSGRGRLVDGCGPIRALFKVVVPAAVPGIVAVAVYAFMTAWGEVLFASVMTNDTTRTLAVGLQLRHPERRVLEPGHGRLPRRQRADRRRLPAPPALPGGRPDRGSRQVTAPERKSVNDLSALPAGFTWGGVATAAYQIEGAVAEDGRAPPRSGTPSRTPPGQGGRRRHR